ncbi:MAG: TIGR04083 family peptide-modifying radical SAM enzyme, partial [Methanobacteriota archaeon]
MKTPFHIMILPTLGCPASCKYCWSSEEGSPVMSLDTMRKTAFWLSGLRDDPVTITFHGGEPLLAGPDFFKEALPLLAEQLIKNTPSFAIQTNLWKMTNEMAEIFAAYHIPIGSSIDGPETLTNMQRGDGYFRKTMAGYEIAKAHGLDVRFICTFTNQSVQSKDEIIRFFREKGFTLKLHPALPSLRSEDPKHWALSPEEYGELLVYLLDQSLQHIDELDIMNINDLCRCVFTRRGTVCTFADCMGNTFAIGPNGSIYPCYRFVGMDEWVMGFVYDNPSLDDLAQSPAWKKMFQFKTFVDAACGSCNHIKYCRGGCPYNAIAPDHGQLNGVDPHCIAYKKAFDEISERIS